MKLIDFHCDTILSLFLSGDESGLRENDLSVDIRKLRAGQVMAQFFALFIDMKKTDDPTATCMAMLNRYNDELKQNSDVIMPAKSFRDIQKNDANGMISALLAIEEGGVLSSNMSKLHEFYQLGVRLITLTWNYPNEIGYPGIKAEWRNRGLTSFGRDVVGEMNRLGMIVDVSHLSDQGFFDVAELTKRPFIASHSNARAVKNHSRNLTDDMIRVLAEKGGVMGINFARNFLGNSNTSLVVDMVRHINHIRSIGGIGVVAMGTDFDGIEGNLEIADSGEIGKLVDGLRAYGFSEGDIEKIFNQNAIRVLKDILG